MNILWQDIDLKEHPSLNKNLDTEVLVIGGGICGILCAYMLSKNNHRVVLVEKNKIGSCRTLKTTAVATALQDVSYDELISSLGVERAKLYLNSCLEAILEYKKLADEFDFDFEISPSYKYYSNKETFEKEYEAIKYLGYKANKVTNIPYIKEGKYIIEFSKQCQFHPLKLIKELSSKLIIYENTKIVKISGNIAITEDNYKIKAKKIVVATGYPFFRFKGLYALKLYQNKSYVAVIKNKNDLVANGIGSNSDDIYFRTYKDYLIIGGNDQKTGQYKQGFLPIINYLKKYYPDANVEYSWVNQDCVSLDNIPYIDVYKNTHVASGFNLWGMTGAMISALQICDLIDNKNNPYIKLFTHRKLKLKPLFYNIKTAVVNLIKPGKRCGHLGCKLFYNENEAVYECPCHGTKYDENGHVIFNPALDDKKCGTKKNH